MLTDDYVIRMITLAISALLRISGLRKNGDRQEAKVLIDLTLEQLLGLRANLVKQMDDERLFYLLTVRERLDTRRLELVADLFAADGEIAIEEGRLIEGRENCKRALKFYLEVWFNEDQQEKMALLQKIESLVQTLDYHNLSAEILWPLSAFYEDVHAYARVEEILLEMVHRPDIKDMILPEIITFYERMSETTPAALAAGGLNRSQVVQDLSRWKKS